MARGTAAGEPIVSQANTQAYRENYPLPGKVQRGRWVWDAAQGRLVDASAYQRPPEARNAPIIADRIHEGTAWHDGERVRDLGSRRKRREFLRETGLAEASDYSPGYREQATRRREREADRKTDSAAEQAVRKLHYQGKWRE